MTKLEKLAREICWVGFSRGYRSVKERGCTKAQYWKRCHEEAKQGYLKEAEHLVWLLGELPTDMLNIARLASMSPHDLPKG